MHIIDSHLHFLASEAEALSLAESQDLKLLNVCVAHGDWRTQQAEPYRKVAQRHPQRFAWCTSFDLPNFADKGYADRVIASLDADFAAGAVGCKIWKHVGMELKSPDGRFVLPDDPIFDPIYAHLARRGWTLLAHIAEPRACWLPLDPASPHYSYYKENPKWHMHGRTDMPSHGQLMDARDHVLAKHPTLRVVGAHLGSLEYSLDELAERLERYPNFACDTSARLGDLMTHPRADLRAFLTKYQDRVLFGTDAVVASENNSSAIKWTRENYARERAFYETDLPMGSGGRHVQGLALSEFVLQKLYVENAKTWYTGL